MIFKHSINSIIRTPKKTVLFIFLLTVITILISIGAGMYHSSRNMLADADKTFTTVVELDYLGDMQGDEVGFYKNMNLDLVDFDFETLSGHKYVKAIDRESSAWAYINENPIKPNNTNLYNYAIVRIGSIQSSDDYLYTGIVNEGLFGKRVRENAYMMISEVDPQGETRKFSFDQSHEYLIIGSVTKGRSPTLILSPGLPEPVEGIPYIVDLTEQPDFLSSEEGQKLLQLQKAMMVVDDSLSVTTVSHLEASDAYYFKEILIKEGRNFQPAEYQEGNNEVIMISQTVADFYQVTVGDKLPLKIHYNKSGTGFSDYLADSRYDYEADYEVVGIIEDKEDNKFNIYMPEQGWLEQDLHSTVLARYIVKNGSGDEFMEDNSEILLPNMKFTLYDQGYDEAIKPVLALRSSAVIIIVLSSLSGIAILILFSYLFVIKQRDTLKTMLSLGTGKRRTMNYILYGALSLVLCASAIGTLISSFFLNRVTTMILETMQNTYGTDVRFSERISGLKMNFQPQVSSDYWLFVLIMLVILMVSFLFLFMFTLTVLREDKRGGFAKKSSRKVKVLLPKRVRVKKLIFARIRPVSLKFALNSLTRNLGRSFIVPLISFVLAVFIVFLGLLSSMQQEELDTVYDRIPVDAYMTSAKNETRDLGGINLQYDIYRLIDPEYSYRVRYDWRLLEEELLAGKIFSFKDAMEEREQLLATSDYFEDIYLYTTVHYEYMGISMTKDGKVNEELSYWPNIRVHSNGFGYDWFLKEIQKMPKLSYADDIRYTPDFFDNKEPEVDFLEGYSFDSLQQAENIGVVSQSFAKKEGITKGDVIRVTAWFEYDGMAACTVLTFKIVGIYDARWQTDTIYIPWITSYDHSYGFDFDYSESEKQIIASTALYELIPRSVRAATFTLKNTKRLTAFRDYLESNEYSMIGNMGDNRRVIVIQDKHLEETVQNLQSHIRFIETIKPIMLILFGVIGFIVSYLLIRHRMNEFAIMRSMGARNRQVFFSFFLEQAMMFFLGLIPVAIYALSAPDRIYLYGMSLLYFILSYLLGTALALLIMNRAKIMDILFTKE